jgi:hypothetical protein
MLSKVKLFLCLTKHYIMKAYREWVRQEPLLFYQVAPQLYSRGWVDPVPDQLLFVLVMPGIELGPPDLQPRTRPQRRSLFTFNTICKYLLMTKNHVTTSWIFGSVDACVTRKTFALLLSETAGRQADRSRTPNETAHRPTANTISEQTNGWRERPLTAVSWCMFLSNDSVRYGL